MLCHTISKGDFMTKSSHQVILYAFDSLYDSFNRHSNRWCHLTTVQGADPWDASPPTPLQASPTPTGFMKRHSLAQPPVCTHTLHLQPWPRCRRPWTSYTIRPVPPVPLPPAGTRAPPARTRPLWVFCRRTVPWASCVRLQLRTSSSSCPHRPTSGLQRFPSARGNSTSTSTCEEQPSEHVRWYMENARMVSWMFTWKCHFSFVYFI